MPPHGVQQLIAAEDRSRAAMRNSNSLNSVAVRETGWSETHLKVVLFSSKGPAFKTFGRPSRASVP